MRPALNLRLRIAIALATVCIAAVGALGLALYTASDEMEEALVDQIVSEEIDHLIERRRENPAYQPAPGPNFQYHIVRMPDEYSQMPPELAALPPGNHEVMLGREERHVAVRQAGDTRFVVVYDVGPHEEREQRFRHLLLLSLASVALITLVLGYWLAGVLTRQLTELATRVQTLTPDAPHSALTSPAQDAEVAALARALDDYQARIARMMEREKEFTANASHELRTPLTAIRTSCELLLAERGLPEKAIARVRMIDDAARRMTEELQTLLFVAREQALGPGEKVLIAECVAEVVEPYRSEIERKGLLLTVDVAHDAMLRVNRQALHTVLVNLLRNAVHYTTHGFIRIDFAERRLTIADSGPGILREDLPRVFQRFYRGDAGAGGFGLGLAIAKRICDHNGWRIEVASEPGSGSAFSVVFP